MSRTHRALFISTLLTLTLGIVLLTGWVLGRRYYPEWREHCIAEAVEQSSFYAVTGKSVPFWWPPSWREEYQRRASFQVHWRSQTINQLQILGLMQDEHTEDQP